MRLLIEFFFTNHNSNFYQIFNGFLFAFYVILTRAFYLQVIDFNQYRVYKRIHGTCIFIQSRTVNGATCVSLSLTRLCRIKKTLSIVTTGTRYINLH